MNIKELIEKYELELKDVQLKFGANYKTKVYEGVLDDLKQLDEPQKPVVPQFVADWYEENKDNLEFNIFDYVYRFDQNAGFDFKDWFDDFNTKPIQTLVNMHQFGYEVEKEKRYLVKLKGIHSESEYLYYGMGSCKWRFREKNESGYFRKTHTRKELEDAGFGEVFNSPLFEVEEVE